MAEAGALVAINAPVLGTLNIVQSIQQQVMQIANTVVYQTLGVVRDITREGSGAVRDTIKAGAVVGRGLTGTLSRAWSAVEKVGSISLRYFLKVVSKATGSPESVAVAILMYRVVDFGVAISPESIDRIFNELKANIDSLRFEIQPVTLPRVNIADVSRAVEEFFNMAKAKIYDLQRSITVPEPRWVDIGCGSPPEWHDVLGWMRYGLCKVAEGLVNGLIRLGYEIARLGAMIVSAMLGFVAMLVDFIKTVSVWFVNLNGVVLNALISGFELIVNGFITIGNFVIGAILEWVVKRPVMLVIDYLVRPVAMFIVSGFNWLKDAMRAILCEYLKVSPFLLGFRYSLKFSEKESNKGLLRGVLRSLLKGFVAFTLTSITVATLVPECSLVPGVEASIPYPSKPEELKMPRLPMMFTSTIKASLTARDLAMSRAPLTYATRVLCSFHALELVSSRVSRVNNASVTATLSVEDTATATGPRSHHGSAYIRVKVFE